MDLRGKFIVFDGTEGCGKSTQVQLLRQRLEGQGIDVVVVRDPGSTRIGEQVRQILLNPAHGEMGMRCEMLLYMSARAQMMHETILPALASGKLVLCDRFVSSTLAYQLGGDGLTADDIRQVAEVAIRGRWPDMTFILDMPAGESLARAKPKFLLPFPEAVKSEMAAEMVKDRIEQRPLSYHERVRENYLWQARQWPQRYRVVKADRGKDEVQEEIWGEVQRMPNSQ